MRSQPVSTDVSKRSLSKAEKPVNKYGFKSKLLADAMLLCSLGMRKTDFLSVVLNWLKSSPSSIHQEDNFIKRITFGFKYKGEKLAWCCC